jgi:hypothetical protein
MFVLSAPSLPGRPLLVPMMMTKSRVSSVLCGMATMGSNSEF